MPEHSDATAAHAAITASTIFHMVTAQAWPVASAERLYRPASLATEGFIHCTGEPERLVWVANRFYRSDPSPYVVLWIDPHRVAAPIRWEEADGHRFPHIYGALNCDAVIDVRPFPRTKSGRFKELSW